MRTRPDPSLVPYAELFDNLSVLSYRDAPSDSSTRFAVELSACGRVFRQYDLDAHRFVAPESGRDYSRSISGTHYRPLRIRGRAERGFWLEVPEAGGRPLLADQFDELYRRTLSFVKPVSVVTNVVGMLTGYSVGYRIATWSSSLCNRAVQERVVESPGIGRMIAREAWRRVLLEPLVMVREGDTEGFVADDVLKTEAGCPYVWREALRADTDGIGVSAWSAEWTANRPEFAPLVTFGQRVAKQLGLVP